jgi:hypothetical protein
MERRTGRHTCHINGKLFKFASANTIATNLHPAPGVFHAQFTSQARNESLKKAAIAAPAPVTAAVTALDIAAMIKAKRGKTIRKLKSVRMRVYGFSLESLQIYTVRSRRTSNLLSEAEVRTKSRRPSDVNIAYSGQGLATIPWIEKCWISVSLTYVSLLLMP